MNLRGLLPFARRWWWLCVLGPLLGAIPSYVVSRQLPRVYEGTARLMFTPGQALNATEDINMVLAGQQLARTDAEIIKSRPIVEAAVQAAGIGLTYDQAARLVTVVPIPNTQLIGITVRANDPTVAADFANLLTAAFLQQTQAEQSSRSEASRGRLASQLDQVKSEIAQQATQLEAARAQSASPSREANIARIQFEVSQLQLTSSRIARAFEDVQLTEARSTDLVSVVEQASPAVVAVEPRVAMNVLLAAAIGLLTGLVLAFILEHLDDRVFSAERVQRFVNLRVVGTVGMFGDGGRGLLDLLAGKASPEIVSGGAAGPDEAFRLMLANLRFAAVERPLKSLLVTSPGAGEGRSTTATRLAMVLVQTRERVVLVDADVRHPALHEMCGVSNDTGLTTLLVDGRLCVSDVLVSTRVPGLLLLPSGPPPPNPGELLASQRMCRRIAELAGLDAQVVIDTPPVLAASGAAALAGMVDGVLLVVDAQRTRRAPAVQAAAILHAAGAHILGAVLNCAQDRTGVGSEYSRKLTTTPLLRVNPMIGRGVSRTVDY